MSFTDEQEYQEYLNKKAEESRETTFDSWLIDLEDKEQPESCSIDNPDCENCGS